METFDTIVIGTGGVGSAALYQLAKRGLRVLGLDQFPQAHAHGSSHGQSRIIRQAYFEHANYVPLLLRAYELWDQVELESQRKLFHQVGILEIGPHDGVLIPGVRRSAEQHNLPVEWLTPQAARAQLPFQIDDAMDVVFESTAGYLLVEECVAAMLQLAESHGATWRQQRVLDWSASSSGVTVTTDQGSFSADRVVICGGAWSRQLLADLGLSLQVLATQQYWFQPTAQTGDMTNWPAYFFETGIGYFYGFPQISKRGAKIAQHGGGTAWPGPQSLDSFHDDADENKVREFLKQAYPPAATLPFTNQTCMYTMSPDEHFIVDHHPNHNRVCFAAGMSGHGFKFTPVLGEILADMVIDGRSDQPIGFLQVSRFS